jgi:hypothetical protein
VSRGIAVNLKEKWYDCNLLDITAGFRIVKARFAFTTDGHIKPADDHDDHAASETIEEAWSGHTKAH